MKIFLWVIAAIIVVGFAMASDLSLPNLLRTTPSQLTRDSFESRRSPWIYKETIDPLTDNVIKMAVAHFGSDNDFVTKIEMSCETDRADKEIFRFKASFYDSDIMTSSRLKTTPTEFLVNLIGFGRIYTQYFLRFGRRPPICMRVSEKYMPLRNSLLVNFSRKTEPLGFPELVPDDWNPGGDNCRYNLKDAETEIREWHATADMVLKVNLDHGDAAFVIDTAFEQPRQVLKSCEGTLGLMKEEFE